MDKILKLKETCEDNTDINATRFSEKSETGINGNLV